MKKKLVFLIFLAIFSFNFLPNLIHKIYYLRTDKRKIEVNRSLYQAKVFKTFTKDFLYLWFQVRGLQIDEGHNKKSKYEEWSEFITYGKK